MYRYGAGEIEENHIKRSYNSSKKEHANCKVNIYIITYEKKKSYSHLR